MNQTGYMLEFAKKGLDITRERGDDLTMVTTLYGPPGWATLQKEMRGRDLDPAQKENLALYMIDWVKYLKEVQNLPVKYLSLHNEGEDWRRWPNDGVFTNFEHGHDYNMYWPPEQVADFLAFMEPMMVKAGLSDVGLTPGETANWYRFWYWGYANAFINNPLAIQNLDLITSHGFYGSSWGRWFSGTGNPGTDLIRDLRPNMHAWVLSMSWGKMNTDFVSTIFMQMYLSNVNGIIPWAAIQRPTHWVNNDPNPGTAFVVNEDGTYQVQPGYYFFKQVSRAGQPGMNVVQTFTRDSEIQIIGFGQNGTKNPDAFVVINTGVTATYRADAVDVFIDGRKYRLSLKDTLQNNFADLNSSVAKTESGYMVEAAVELKRNLASGGIPFNLVIIDGESSVEGQREWKENGKIGTGKEKNDVSIHKVLENPPEVDGVMDKHWSGVKEFTINNSIHPNTSDQFKGKWRGYMSNEKLFLLVEIEDPTNIQERHLLIHLKGTEYKQFNAFRSSDAGEQYKSVGIFEVDNGVLVYDAPPHSVTTFYGVE